MKTTETSQENTNNNDNTILLLSQQRRQNIHDEMNNYQRNVVRGHDKENRAILFAFPRRSNSSNSNAAVGEEEERFLDSVMYILERSNACSEFISIGKQDQTIGILDTKNSSCPSIRTIKNTLTILQKHYPGRLKNFIILNPPYIIRGIYKMIKPFLDPITANKFIIINNNNTTSNDASITKRNKERVEVTSTTEATIISNVIDDSQAMPALLPGKGKLTSDINIDRFLYHVPFYQLYDYADDDYNKNNDEDYNMNDELKESLSSSTTTTTTTITTDLSLSDDDIRNNRNIIEGKIESGRRDVVTDCGGSSSFRNIATVRSLATGQVIINKNRRTGSSSSSVLLKIIHPTITTAYTYYSC
jgi:hypothetical protein